MVSASAFEQWFFLEKVHGLQLTVSFSQKTVAAELSIIGWLRGQDLNRTSESSPELPMSEKLQPPSSLVVVNQDQSALVA